jgi:hypothetical protein
MKKIAVTLAIVFTLQTLAMPVSAQFYASVDRRGSAEPISPCEDERYLTLKDKPLEEMTDREYDYFREKERECSDFTRAILLQGAQEKQNEPMQVTVKEEKSGGPGVGIIILAVFGTLAILGALMGAGSA